MDKRWALAGLAAAGLALAGCSPVAARSAGPETVYVGGAGELRAISAEDLSTQARLPLGGAVVAGAVDAGRQRLQVAVDGPAPAWLGISTERNRIAHRLELDFDPVALAAEPGATASYVFGNHHGAARLVALNPANGARLGRRELPGTAAALALGHDQGQPLLLAAVDHAPALLLLTPDGLRRRGQVALDSPPRQVVGLPYGHKAFVLCADTVAVVDTALPGLLTYLRLGREPQAMLLKPDGGELYISNADGTVSVVNTTTNEVDDTMAAGLGAGAMAVGDGGNYLYVANADAGTVSVISIADRRTMAVIHVGQQPRRLALDAGGLLLFAADAGSGDVAVMRSSLDPASPNSLLTLLAAPAAPGFLAVAPR